LEAEGKNGNCKKEIDQIEGSRKLPGLHARPGMPARPFGLELALVFFLSYFKLESLMGQEIISIGLDLTKMSNGASS